MSVFEKKRVTEEKRFQNISTQIKNQHLAVLRQWRATKRFFTGERGAWAERYANFTPSHVFFRSQPYTTLQNFRLLQIEKICG